ncbi:hypothetical protein HMPREF9374_3508 [Desmospora sp. 8437]|nr:hypothetical protein HMPREF9374_3508 [Desmospora sp. 8437]
MVGIIEKGDHDYEKLIRKRIKFRNDPVSLQKRVAMAVQTEML